MTEHQQTPPEVSQPPPPESPPKLSPEDTLEVPGKIPGATYRIGCVSYLNAKPLIHSLDDQDDVHVRYDVPSRLFDDLVSDEVDVALCPVADLHRREAELCVVPVGGIASEDSTLTVRLFSQVPLDQITQVHADTDSHTSVMLLRVLSSEIFGRMPAVIDYHVREHVAEGRLIEQPQAVLLIGDKVMTNSPLAVRYPYQLDLGEAWYAQTGLPFVFAVWTSRVGVDLGNLPQRLEQTRLRNAGRIDELVARYAQVHGWANDLAGEYLGRILTYAVGPRELEAIERFSALADALGLLPCRHPLQLYPS